MEPKAWGLLLLVSSLFLAVALWKENVGHVAVWSFVGFLLWANAIIAFVISNDMEYVILLRSVNILIYVYIYLANSAGRLWDYAPEKKE